MKISRFKELSNLEAWKSMIVQRLKSNLSVSAWCEQNGISQQQYYYRLRKVRESVVDEIENNRGVLVKYTPQGELLNQSDVTAHQDNRIVVKYGNSQTEFPEGTDITIIALLIKELNSD